MKLLTLGKIFKKKKGNLLKAQHILDFIEK